jgi:hypothetical protein
MGIQNNPNYNQQKYIWENVIQPLENTVAGVKQTADNFGLKKGDATLFFHFSRSVLGAPVVYSADLGHSGVLFS